MTKDTYDLLPVYQITTSHGWFLTLVFQDTGFQSHIWAVCVYLANMMSEQIPCSNNGHNTHSKSKEITSTEITYSGGMKITPLICRSLCEVSAKWVRIWTRQQYIMQIYQLDFHATFSIYFASYRSNWKPSSGICSILPANDLNL